jgi:hypothetical protein
LPRRQSIVAGGIDGLSGAQLHQAVIEVLGRRRPAHIAERVNCQLMLIDPHPRTYTVLQIAKLTDHFRFIIHLGDDDLSWTINDTPARQLADAVRPPDPSRKT